MTESTGQVTSLELDACDRITRREVTLGDLQIEEETIHYCFIFGSRSTICCAPGYSGSQLFTSYQFWTERRREIELAVELETRLEA